MPTPHRNRIARRRRISRGRLRELALRLGLVSLLAGTVVGVPPTTPVVAASSVEDEFVWRINHARVFHDAARLTVRDSLARVGREQALRMADRTALFHNPDLTTEVKNWRWVGENVGYGPDVLTVHRAFMHSPPHRANVLDRDYTQVGVGAVVRDGRVWVSVVFRQPQR